LRRIALIFVLISISRSLACAQQSSDRTIRNSYEIYREIKVDPASQGKVRDYFPTFLDYQDMVMFHPKFGYYSSGRVNFTDDYQTFPIVLAPAFGNMIAEHLFQMWDGMRQAGTLSEGETFTIGEFGAGNGAMAESILEYIQSQAAKDARWAAFARQAIYVCYDRSPALNEIQRERNRRFGSRFDGRVADATDLTATIKPGSLKGVVLSNELPDAFSVHKVILTSTSAPEVAYVIPSFALPQWTRIRAMVSPELARIVDEGDATIEKTFFRREGSPEVYLTKTTFTSLLETLVTHTNYESVARALEFHEVYVPVSNIPELAAHLQRYASEYAAVLARDNQGILTYINLGVEKMIQGSGEILKAGYVMTIDYGSSWDGILGNDGSRHFRTYGPAHRAASAQANIAEDNSTDKVQTSDPYDGPTLNDMTTDVNFSLLSIEGQRAGLRTLFYGSQKALQSGTSISLDEVPDRARIENLTEKFTTWASDFRAPSVYKLMIQQKEGTDSKYRFPDNDPESLGLGDTELTDAQREHAGTIQRRLSGR
jgi:SAM-dependent MidA family methyltransferase